jgi:hypothetical protein
MDIVPKSTRTVFAILTKQPFQTIQQIRLYGKMRKFVFAFWLFSEDAVQVITGIAVKGIAIDHCCMHIFAQKHALKAALHGGGTRP